MKFWTVKIPYTGSGVIPIKSDKEPSAFDSEISSKLHTGFIDESWPRYFRDKAEVEEVDEDTFNMYEKAATKRFKRKAAIIEAVVKGVI